MKRREGCEFRVDYPHHVYSKSEGGFIIFYSVEDCIFYYTLYSVLATRYGVEVSSFCLMPNHIHSQERVSDIHQLRDFHRLLNSLFSQKYNARHHRSGILLHHSFGHARKTTGKKIRENIVYIANNPVVGGLCDDVMDYRWNLLPYYFSTSPFSTKIRLRFASAGLRRAIKLVNHFRRKNLDLDYRRQEIIFSNLAREEKRQLVDYIISEYSFIDFNFIKAAFGGSFENAVDVMKSNAGSEFDIKEDADNYSSYTDMSIFIRDRHYDLKTFNPESLNENEKKDLFKMLLNRGHKDWQIERFLHIDLDDKGWNGHWKSCHA